MQADFSATMGNLSGIPRDRSGRPRFCGRHGCVDPNRPLADRVYHCSHLGEKCEKDARRPRHGVHLPVYDHFCGWLRVSVYLDTIKPFLLLMAFLLLDAVIVFSCSIAAMSLPEGQATVVHAPMMVLAAIIVLWLCWQHVHLKFWHLAMRNITMPEMGRMRLTRGGSILFAIRLNPTQDFFLESYRGNPWDLGWRNLHQVFGGWDCLLPHTQPPRCVGYGLGSRSDFEMSDEFWRWVEEKERVHRARAAGPRPAVALPPPDPTSPDTMVPPEEIPLPDSPTPQG